jgi:exopolyphosphatase/guanosine-5'-triphosphate,3'-diphosphate pyrophosphatase
MDRPHLSIFSGMKIASIDIGTNTILLLIAETEHGSIKRVFHDEQAIARIGKGVDRAGVISRETFSRALQFFQSYQKTIRLFNVNKIIAVGTSALRDAVNKVDFCNFIFTECGISIEILTGDEEAEWTYWGGISEFIKTASSFCLLDIGGGSTEIIAGTAESIHSKISLNIGCVRITERFLHGNPPHTNEVSEARLEVRAVLQEIKRFLISESLVVGVAGTVTTLAALELQLPHYDPEKVTGFRLNRSTIQKQFQKLSSMTTSEIGTLRQVSPGREDIILAGILILDEFMEQTSTDTITVSDRGLRYGMVLRELGRSILETR